MAGRIKDKWIRRGGEGRGEHERACKGVGVGSGRSDSGEGGGLRRKTSEAGTTATDTE